jgi:chemotaxis protein methyltransferase CheR
MKFSDTAFVLFRDLIVDNCGLYFDGAARRTLERVVEGRIRATGLKTLGHYHNYLLAGPDREVEIGILVNSLTNNETNFFRHPGQFEALTDYVLPALIEKKMKSDDPRQRCLSIWSAGCASGDETYSIAIAAKSILDNNNLKHVEILGTDINSDNLARAREAVYSKRTIQYVSNLVREGNIESIDATHQVSKPIRDMVSFDIHNLIRKPYPQSKAGPWDIVFCRNVLSFFQVKTMKQVLNDIHDNMVEGGYLFLGYSEVLRGIDDTFTPVRFGDAFVYMKRPREQGSDGRTATRRTSSQRNSELEGKHELYAEALEQFENEDFEQALTTLTALLRAKPGDIDGRFLMGRLYLEQGLLHEALYEFAGVIADWPLHVPAHYLLGVAYKMTNMSHEAAKQFRKVLRLDPHFALGHFALASINKDEGNHERAIQCYQNTIECLELSSNDDPIPYARVFTPSILIELCQRDIESLEASVPQR